jgi:hypothetical protein
MMKRVHLPALITLAVVALMLAYGPIAQLPDYHAFADRSRWLGVEHAGDVFSNLGFALVGLWGFWRLYPLRGHAALRAGWPGWALFLVALTLTGAGSAYYHLAPDNLSLVWDRLPIALACAGLLAAVRAETLVAGHAGRDAAWLGLFAVASVAWWYGTELLGWGDLRPYLLLQVLPILLIPVWQAMSGVSGRERWWFGAALLLYVLAKVAELNDHALLAALGWVSGHTLKHVLATLAAGVLVAALARRVGELAGAYSRRINIQHTNRVRSRC